MRVSSHIFNRISVHQTRDSRHHHAHDHGQRIIQASPFHSQPPRVHPHTHGSGHHISVSSDFPSGSPRSGSGSSQSPRRHSNGAASSNPFPPSSGTSRPPERSSPSSSIHLSVFFLPRSFAAARLTPGCRSDATGYLVHVLRDYNRRRFFLRHPLCGSFVASDTV